MGTVMGGIFFLADFAVAAKDEEFIEKAVCVKNRRPTHAITWM